MIKGLRGESVTQCAYVESGLTEAAYFASPCKFGPNGVEEVILYEMIYMSDIYMSDIYE